MTTVENTPEPQKLTETDATALQLALNYCTVGLGELELLLQRRQAAGFGPSLGLEDSAGYIALALQEMRRHLPAQ